MSLSQAERAQPAGADTQGPDSLAPVADDRANLIVFEGVGKEFVVDGERMRAVQNVNLSVRTGEFITLVGPSGCGKSTLLNMCAGLFAPTEGKVLYDGAEVTPYNPSVGYMTQSDHLLPWRDVVGNVSVPLEIKGLDKGTRTARVQELLELVGLTGFEKSYPSQLSGGMRKRCALARILAYDPQTLLMDEPFGALDAMLRLRMQIEIRELCRKLGKTVMFVTHDLDEAVALADRCAVFTRRPGTIERIVDVPLPPDRDLMQLRKNPQYVELTATLWEFMAPNIGLEDHA